MLLSMSKQVFTERMFTDITLNLKSIESAFPTEVVFQLLAFHNLTNACLKSPAMNMLSACPSRLCLSVGAESSLSKAELQELAKVRLFLVRKLSACNQLGLVDPCPISISTQTQGGAR
jgi:hypothetical protein